MAKKKTKAKKSAPPFEQSLEELETIVGELEGGELGLDQALDQYEQGVQRLRACHDQLEQAERKIQLLSGVDAQGNPVTEPLAGGRGKSGEKSREKRPTRKSAETGGASGVDDSTRLF